MQLSVPRYQAIAVGRGANLDEIDKAFPKMLDFIARLREMRGAGPESEMLRSIREFLAESE